MGEWLCRNLEFTWPLKAESAKKTPPACIQRIPYSLRIDDPFGGKSAGRT